MKIIALCKTWSGAEWLTPCIESIYKHCEKIVLLTSNISWIGGHDNPSIPVIENIIKEKDSDNKVIHINYDESNQLKHCEYGYKYIQNNFDCDYVQLIDSDEIWNDTDYLKAIEYLKTTPDYSAYRTSIYTYIKSVYYQLDPIEPLKPVCFIKSDLKNMGTEPRGCMIQPFYIMQDVFYHHYGFVRYHFNKVLEKIVQSHVSEKQPYESMDKWIPNVWNKIPNCKENFHMAIGFGTHWKRIKMLDFNSIPEILKKEEYRKLLTFGCE